MLKLKRVELQGFKSFCDRTELRFNGGGIAAVVGPNGCGKSNLSDAISWVLGEQSAKSLRGARMEDVIFAGTRDRKPLGLAAVTMTLVDPMLYQEAHEAAASINGTNGHAGPIPITAPQGKNGGITITRRLFRSGESEYLINGHTARLRDIQDIFMGTGLGPESYAIIEQGRIGQILSSKPQDRHDGAYAPFGENYAETGTTDRNFTGQNQDLTPGATAPLYDFLYREYQPTQGRWVSPDPAGINAVDPSDPQSWNEYAYGLNGPALPLTPLGSRLAASISG